MRNMSFEPKMAGMKFTAINSLAGLSRFDNLGSYSENGNNYTPAVSANYRTFTCTGWISYETNNYENTAIYQVQGYTEYGIPQSQIGYWRYSGKGRDYTLEQAQKMVNKLLNNNQYIFENNLLLSRFANKLNSSQKQNLYYLQKRLEKRENMLREADVFSQMQEARIMGYSNYESYLNQFMYSYSQGIGIAIMTIIAIIVGVAIVSSLATAAYYAFKDAYDESKKDVELSRKMLQIFEKYQMTEEDIAIIKKETQGIVTKRVLMEKINNWLGNSKMLIVGGLAVLLGYKIYQNYLKK